MIEWKHDIWITKPVLCFPKVYFSNWKASCKISRLDYWTSKISIQFSLSVVSDSASPWTATCQASLSITNSQSLPKLMSLESMMPSNHLILHCYLLLVLSIYLSTGGFSSESALWIRWLKYWSFSFSPSNEFSEFVSFRIDLLTIQGTLKSLLQHHSSKASVLQS